MDAYYTPIESPKNFAIYSLLGVQDRAGSAVKPVFRSKLGQLSESCPLRKAGLLQGAAWQPAIGWSLPPGRDGFTSLRPSGAEVRLSRFAPFPTVALVAGCSMSGPGVPTEISVPEGFEVELAAAPPLVDRPMILSMDDQGRLYVAESSGSNDHVQTQLAERPHSILQLRDLDGDGRYDTRTVFADRMMLPEGVLWHAGSVYVAAPPSIWKLTDVDGDGVADQREEWFEGKTLTNCANDLHGPYLGRDGWIYWTKGAFAEQTYDRPGREPLVTRAAHVFRRRPEGGPVEIVLTGGMDNPVEVAFAPDGERFLTSTFLHHPELGKRDGIVHAVYGGVYGKVHSVTDGHPMTGGFLRVMADLGPAAPVGLARYASSSFGDEYRGRLFSTAFNLRRVSSHRLVPNGATFTTEDEDFLVSTSRDFHPTDVMEDADGSLLVVDTGAWYKLCCPTAQMEKPDVLGAIYRVRRVGAEVPVDPRGDLIDWGGAGHAALAGLLDDRRPFVQTRAVAALASPDALETLRETLSSGTRDARLNALWALTRIDGSEPRAIVRAALADEAPEVRRAALHSVALHRDSGAREAATALLKDSSAAVRRVAAEALGRIGDARAVPALLAAAAMSSDDEVLTHSLVFALIEIADGDATAGGLTSSSPATERAAMIALDQMSPPSLDGRNVLGRLHDPDSLVSGAARWIAGRHPEWGGLLAGYLASRLDEFRGGNSGELKELLAGFAANSRQVQQLLAEVAGQAARPEVASLALEAMASASIESAPPEWPRAIAAALAMDEARSSALRAVRYLPRGDEGHPALDLALVALARDPRHSPEVRTRALEAAASSLQGLDPELFRLVSREVLATRPVEVRLAAARVIGSVALDRSQLLAVADLLPEVGPMELPHLVEAFGQSEDEAVGSRLVAGLARAPGLANLRADVGQRASARFDVGVRDALDALLAGEVKTLESQQARLEGLLESLDAGDAERGLDVFNSSETACLACHSMGYTGGKLGPDLTSIGQIRERRDLLEAIVYPSASFVRSYEPVVAVTEGDSVSGLIVEEGASHVLIAVNADERVRFARSEVEEIRPGTVSVMPSGLDAQISERDLADLLAFLEATKWGPVGPRR